MSSGKEPTRHQLIPKPMACHLPELKKESIGSAITVYSCSNSPSVESTSASCHTVAKPLPLA
jgi:hypothetical protein